MTGVDRRAKSAKVILRPSVRDLTDQILPSFRDTEEEMLFHIISDVHHGRHSVAENYAFQEDGKDDSSRPRTSKDYKAMELSHRLQVQRSAVLRSRLWPVRKVSKFESASLDFTESPRRTCHNGIFHMDSLFIQGHAKLDGDAKMVNGFPPFDMSLPSPDRLFTPRTLSSRPGTARQLVTTRPQFRKVLSKSPPSVSGKEKHLPKISNGFKVQTFKLPRKERPNGDDKEDNHMQSDSDGKANSASDMIANIELKIYGSEIL